MALSGETAHKIHKALYNLTISNKKMFAFMVKVANKAVKRYDRRADIEANSIIFMTLLSQMDYNGKIKKVINKQLVDKAESGKQKIIKNYIKDSRDTDKWIYLASSHRDSAKDHAPYQGKLYYDDKAPEDVVKYCKNRGMDSIQWVMGGPVWFITRPNCRHYFKALPLKAVKKYSVKELTRRYKTHREEGDRDLATPARVAVEEYTDRLKLYEMMYNEHPTEFLRRMIQKTKLLLKKWKNEL